MYNTFSNYLKIPRCALDDDNQVTKSEKTKAEKTKAKTKEKQPKPSFKRRYDC